MQLVLRLLAVALLAAGIPAVVPAPLACACSCVGYTTKQAVASATVVFEGDVVDRQPASPGMFGDEAAYTIAVTRVYKGELGAWVQVSAATAESACGVALKGHVLVFANGRGDDLSTNLCSAPMVVEKAKLGTGRAPGPATGATTPGSTVAPPSATPSLSPDSGAPANSGVPPLALWGAAGAVAVAALAIWLIRRTRS